MSAKIGIAGTPMTRVMVVPLSKYDPDFSTDGLSPAPDLHARDLQGLVHLDRSARHLQMGVTFEQGHG